MRYRLAIYISGAILCAALNVSCARQRSIEETVVAYADAIQRLDFDTLYCLSAGASSSPELGADPATRRGSFIDWATAQHEVYLEGRDEGWVELEPHGIQLVKLFSLGRGTFSKLGLPRALAGAKVADATVVEATLTFGYAQIDLSPFSPGTTFYLSGLPVGRVHPVRVPAGESEVSVEALTSIRIEWTLARQAPSSDCEGGWTVASVVPVEDSADSVELALVF